MPQISIIIPVYNAEANLAHTIESVLAQRGVADFELLLVNDGSRDGSLAVCGAFAAKDARIKVIDKENGGVSSARNAGLDAATGEWVMFVDADDSLTPDALEVCLPYLERHDIVRFAVVDLFADGSTRPRKLRRACSQQQLLRQTLGHATMVSVCASLFRRSLFQQHHIRFDEGVRYGEDWLVFARLVAHSHRVKLLPHKRCYVYNRSNEQSCSNTINIAGHIEALEVVEVLRKEFGPRYERDYCRARCRLGYAFLKECGPEECARLWAAHSHRVAPITLHDTLCARRVRLRRRVRLSKLARRIEQLRSER